jgi:hypothetical protein
MPTSASVFPLAHIALTAAITAGVALLVLVILLARLRAFSLFDCLLVALVVGNAARCVAVCWQYRRAQRRSHSRGQSQ